MGGNRQPSSEEIKIIVKGSICEKVMIFFFFAKLDIHKAAFS